MSEIKYNLKHEKIVLGTLLKNPDARRKYVKIIQFSEIHGPHHKTIFSGLQAVEEQGLAYTPATIITLLPQSDWGGAEYLDKLEREGLNEVDNLEHHIERMRWDAVRIRAIEHDIPQILTDLKDPRSDPEEVLRQANDLRDGLGNTKSTRFFEGGSGLANKYSASLIARQIVPTFRSSGYKALDKKLSEGFAAGKMSVIAGSSSNGKTSLMLNLALRQSRSWKIGILAWEGGVQSAIDSLVAMGTKTPLEKILKFAQLFTQEEQKNVDDFLFNLLDSDKIAFLKTPPRSVLSGKPWDINNQLLDWVESQFEEWKRDINYWDLFTKKLAAREPDHVSAALDRVQEMAAVEHLNQHICLLHQVTLKDVEKRKDQRPTRDALKGTGAWIENPDLILAVYRPALYEPGTKDNIMEIICLKQRRGAWPWKMLSDWDGELVSISNLREGVFYANGESSNGYDDGL